MHTVDSIPVALVGCGNLGSKIAEDLHKAGPYSLVATLDIPMPSRAKAVASMYGGRGCDTLDELLATNPRYVIEAATVQVFKDMALPVLQHGADLIILSAGAFADDDFVDTLRSEARALGRIVHVPSGAIGAFDLAQAARAAGDLSCSMYTEKPPAALEGAPWLKGRTLSREVAETVYEGTARQAIAAFPQNVNVVTAMAFASVGVDAVTATVISSPERTLNKHTIVFEGAFGKARCEIEARPSPQNPRSSMLAAYSIIALLQKLADPIRF